MNLARRGASPAKYRLSFPLKRLLDAAAVEPARLNRALGHRIRHRQQGMNQTDHFPRLITKATGVRIAELHRRNCSMLVEVTDNLFLYREYSRRNCVLTCPGTLPETVLTAVPGLPIERVIELGLKGAFLRGCVIVEAVSFREATVAFRLQPHWVEFWA